MSGVKWRTGRVVGSLDGFVASSGTEPLTFRCPQALAYLDAPPDWGVPERAVLLALLAWSQSIEGDPRVFMPTAKFLTAVTGNRNLKSLDETMRRLATPNAIANLGNRDRSVGKQVKGPLLTSDPCNRFGFRWNDALWRACVFPQQFTVLELGVVQRLGRKYGLALYPMAATVASRADSPHVWLSERPEDLARWLGYRPKGGFRYGGFLKDALMPAIRDIVAAEPTRLSVEEGIDADHAAGRGRRVELVKVPLTVPVEHLKERKAPRNRMPKNQRVPTLPEDAAAVEPEATPVDFDDVVAGLGDAD